MRCMEFSFVFETKLLNFQYNETRGFKFIYSANAREEHGAARVSG